MKENKNMRNYDGYQLVSETVNLNERVGLIGGGALLGGAIGAGKGAIKYDELVMNLERQIKNETNPKRKELLQNKLTLLKKGGRGMHALKKGGKGAAIGAGVGLGTGLGTGLATVGGSLLAARAMSKRMR